MNDNFKKEIRQRWEMHDRKAGRGRAIAGLLLLIIGILLLLKTTGAIIFPAWFFTWPMILIAFGIFSGIKHGFRGPIWAIMLLIGGFGLADKMDPTMQLTRFIWPVVIMAIGLMFILRPRRRCRDKWRGYHDRWNQPATATEGADANAETAYDAAADDRRDFLEVTSVFGGVKKNVLSKSFKGGDIVSFMGGSEIDLTQADFNGRITIDATNIFGGTKLIVPPTWDVQSDITAIFGGVDDKRQVSGINLDPNKVLILDGTCMFGGIEIRSF
jgi:predicted membrane protein